MGKDRTERSNAYSALLNEALTDELLAEIRIYLQQQRALGHDVRAMVEDKTRRFAGIRPTHRLSKSIASGE